MAETKDVLVPRDVVEATIQAFTDLDESGDKRTMNKMARRLGKEQPALLQFAAKCREENGDNAGEAAVFYGTLIWAIFDRQQDQEGKQEGKQGKQGKCPRLTSTNLTEAEEIVSAAHAEETDLKERTLVERTAAPLVERQPHIYAKLAELLAEDMRFAGLADKIERGADFEAIKGLLGEDDDTKELRTQIDEGADFDVIKASIQSSIESDAITVETAEAIFTPTQVVIEAFDAAFEGRRPGERLGPIVRDQPKVGRNEPCTCGSGKKFKKCCGKN